MVAGAYGLIRYAMSQSKELAESFIDAMDKSSERQEAAHERLATALDSQGKVLERIAERVRC